MAKSISSFQTIRTEGALFPPDILQRIASLKVDGTRAEDYHLPPGFKVKEAITASWTALRAHWTNFQEARESLDEDDTGTAVTNDRWLLPLFKELDYGRLTTEKSPVIDDRSYPIERFYNNTPIHLIGCNLPLDRRTRGARGAATASPHSMMQEFLNRSEHHLWAFISNGRQLRILRDNISLSRQAYVEFDLEAMMEGEVYSDFALMWLLCHQSRVEAVNQEQCWLESWSGLAREQGTRVLKQLRVGVEKSIEALGQGFISHPRNDQLREKLQSGALTKDEYYRQLLRIVYRLLFLFVAEDRELLHPTDADPKASELYDQYYSTRRLREMAERIRGSKHADLWHSLSLVFHSLGQDDGCPQLGLIGLGSFLWRASSTADLNGPLPNEHSQFHSGSPRSASGRGAGDEEFSENDPVYISNDHLLLSMRALAYVEQDRVLRTVDYRNLGSEELGSVYESLLELHPQMHVEAKTFTLDTAAGNERKTTGSYYTPDSLVQCLLDSALEPVVEQRLKEAKQLSRSKITLTSGGSDAVAAGEGSTVSPDWLHRVPIDKRDALTSGNYIQVAEHAILALTVCDPACGSGHFLISAAHRLARHLARVRTGESEPSPEDHQHALRDVIGRCIYGVDINPMAVELCKVSLWMEAIEPGKPLSFLDHHIQCGNSLLGTTPKLLADGIPDDAFKPVEGDDPEVCRELKARNHKERTGAKQRAMQQELWERKDGIKLGNMAEVFALLSAGDDDTVEAIRKKELEYAKAIRGEKYRYSCLLSDLWCAAFVWKKDESDLGRLCPTQYYLKQVEKNPHSIPKAMETEVRRLAEQYALFHWHLVFPEVFVLQEEVGNAWNKRTGWNHGFDVVLGNPPWDQVQFDPREFFATSAPEFLKAPTTNARNKLIKKLASDQPRLYSEFVDSLRQDDSFKHFTHASGRSPLSGYGRLNLAPMFAETALQIQSRTGRVGIIVPTGIATDSYSQGLFNALIDGNSIHSLLDFENSESIFPGVHRSYKFCLLTLVGDALSETDGATFVFFSRNIAESQEKIRRFVLCKNDFEILNPNTKTCPVFRTRHDAELTKYFYGRVPILVNEAMGDNGNPWQIQSKLMFYMNKDSHRFHDAQSLCAEGLSLVGNRYVGKEATYLPLYEGKMFSIYDHRAADVVINESAQKRAGQQDRLTSEDRSDPTRMAQPRFWVSQEEVSASLNGTTSPWLIAVPKVTSPTNQRTFIAAALPRTAVSDSVFLLLSGPGATAPRALLLSNFLSFVLDFITRQKVGGVNLNFFIQKQLTILPPEHYETVRLQHVPISVWLMCRVLELTYTAWDLEAFALDCGFDGPPFRWNEERRFLLRCELDAAYFYLYLGAPEEWGAGSAELCDMFPTPRDAVEYIMETFPIVKRKDIARTEVKNAAGEVVTPGTYITKDTILEIYDEMATAIATGGPYQTRLNPPPGPPTDSNGNFIPMAKWDPNNWPSHIHPPRSTNNEQPEAAR